MTRPIVFGSLFSSFVRTVVLALEEKGVDYELRQVRPHSPELGDRHPFGKVPTFEHGDVKLFETLAIVSYVNEAFPGPSLAPSTIEGRAEMLKWMSLVADSVYGAVVKGWALEHFFPRGPDGAPDADAIAKALPKARRALEVVDRALEGRRYLVGDALTLADLYLAPIAASATKVPGGDALLADLPNLGRWTREITARPSFAKTVR